MGYGKKSAKFQIAGDSELKDIEFSDCASTRRKHSENAKEFIMKEEGISDPSQISIKEVITKRKTCNVFGYIKLELG